jgi:hypothetical protein
VGASQVKQWKLQCSIWTWDVRRPGGAAPARGRAVSRGFVVAARVARAWWGGDRASDLPSSRALAIRPAAFATTASRVLPVLTYQQGHVHPDASIREADEKLPVITGRSP